MEIQILTPSQMELEALAVDEAGIKMTPRFLRGQIVFRVGYLKAVGNNGVTTNAVLLFNANNGTFSTQTTNVDAPVVPVFDRTPAEFNAKRTAKIRTPGKTKPETGDTKNGDEPRKDVH